MMMMEEEGKKQHRTGGAEQSGRIEENSRECEEEPPQLHPEPSQEGSPNT